jgi:hypothetical protein
VQAMQVHAQRVHVHAHAFEVRVDSSAFVQLSIGAAAYACLYAHNKTAMKPAKERWKPLPVPIDHAPTLVCPARNENRKKITRTTQPAQAEKKQFSKQMRKQCNYGKRVPSTNAR